MTLPGYLGKPGTRKEAIEERRPLKARTPSTLHEPWRVFRKTAVFHRDPTHSDSGFIKDVL